VLAARDLTAQVIRVDDFPQDLGASAMRLEALLDTPRAMAATGESAAPHKAAA
jgi:hypothetical protein